MCHKTICRLKPSSHLEANNFARLSHPYHTQFVHEKGNFLQIESQISNTSCIPVYPKCCSVCSDFKLNTLS